MLSTKALSTAVKDEQLENTSENELEKPSENQPSEQKSERNFNTAVERRTKRNTGGSSDPRMNDEIFPRVESVRRPGHFYTYNRSSYNRIPFCFRRNATRDYGSGWSNIRAFSAVRVRLDSSSDYMPSRGLSDERFKTFARLTARNKERQCTICMTSVGGEVVENGGKIVELDCGHVFCDECVKKWFRRNTTCPNCRRDFSNS